MVSGEKKPNGGALTTEIVMWQIFGAALDTIIEKVLVTIQDGISMIYGLLTKVCRTMVEERRTVATSQATSQTQLDGDESQPEQAPSDHLTK